jgi:polar amino acid transport system substrate-binding protein
MRRIVVMVTALALVALVGAACSPKDEPSDSASTATPTDVTETAEQCALDSNVSYIADGQLTIATGNPAYPPWFEGGEMPGSDFKLNDPATQEGFESAVAYAVAGELGFEADQVAWIPLAFAKSYAPGPKDFDVGLQQISFSEKRAQAVDFTDSYYDVNQALVSTKGSAIDGATTIGDLSDAKLGAPIGTTSLTFIEETIQPNQEASVYDDLNGAVTDLTNGTIDGIVVDLPTAFYVSAVQVPKGVIVGQFEGGGSEEYFGMTLGKGNPLTRCIDLALAQLKDDGRLADIQQEWLADKASAPVITA